MSTRPSPVGLERGGDHGSADAVVDVVDDTVDSGSQVGVVVDAGACREF